MNITGKRRLTLRAAARNSSIFVAVSALGAPAFAAPATVTVPEVQTLNLLSPFLNLNATSVGQATLTANLNQSIAVNHYAATSSVIEATSISDKTIFGSASTSITLANGTTANYGPGANLAGGLPLQAVQSTGGIAPYQQYGGLGSLGTAYQAAVAPSGAAVPSLVTLLDNAYTFTSTDLGVAKFYFANGTTNGTTAAVAPAGQTLPTAAGLPSLTNSVYDQAYGVKNTGTNQDVYGDSRPVQVDPSGITGYDPTALTGLATNPSFPSGHTTYAYTQSILIGMLSPQFFQSMLLSGSEYGNSRISLGVHYPLDIIASRSFASFQLAELLNDANANYTQTNAVTGATPQNINTQFAAAATAYNSYLNTQTGVCGGSLAACAASNPYNTYSASTYGAVQGAAATATTTAAENSAIYQYRLTYGLPTLSLAAAPHEQAPADTGDASILLATVYGGSTTAAQNLANSVGGALYGNLSTATINQVIVNTEGNALAAFYGTDLSYWSRIDLYDAAGYFSNVTGTVTLASGDKLKENVTVAATGVFQGAGTVTGNVAVQSGGALGYVAGAAPLTVTGTTTLLSGANVRLSGAVSPGTTYTIVNSTGTISVAPGVGVITPYSAMTNLMSAITGTLAVTGDPVLTVKVTSDVAATTTNGNARAAAGALDTAANAGGLTGAGLAFYDAVLGANTAATATAAFDTLSGDGLVDMQQAELGAAEGFSHTLLAQTDTPSDHVGTRVWISGFGGSTTLDANGGLGASKVSSTTGGAATGITTTIAPGTVAGFGIGASDVRYNAGATKGTSNGGQAGAFALTHMGGLYVRGSADVSYFGEKTARGANVASGSAFALLGRGEVGKTLPVGPIALTPYAAFQVEQLFGGSLTEGGSPSALSLAAKPVSDDQSDLGFKTGGLTQLGGHAVATFIDIAWQHDYHTARSARATFDVLPGATFTVQGAPVAANAALIGAGAKMALTPRLSAYAQFNGTFATTANSYGGTGGLSLSF